MSTNLPEQQPSEEVDLGQLFKLIGNAFDRFFKFIGKILKGLFFLLIEILVLIQSHIKKFILVGVLGIIIGTYFDVKKPPVYESHMVVEPNFYSTNQLYSNIDYFNSLVGAKDSITLSKALGITLNEAASIQIINIERYALGNQKVALYDEFIKKLDTASRKYIDFQKYSFDFSTLDSRFHDVAIISENPKVAKKTQDSIVKSVDDKDYFILQKALNNKNIELRDALNVMQINEIDSIQRTIRDVMRKSAEHTSTGTNINLADSKGSDNKELSLIKQIDIIKQRQVELNKERGRMSKIVNVISDFPEKGRLTRSFFNSHKFILFCVFTGLMFSILLLLELNKYLKQYKREKLKQ